MHIHTYFLVQGKGKSSQRINITQSIGFYSSFWQRRWPWRLTVYVPRACLSGKIKLRLVNISHDSTSRMKHNSSRHFLCILLAYTQPYCINWHINIILRADLIMDNFNYDLVLFNEISHQSELQTDWKLILL